MPFQLTLVGLSDIGQVRRRNEDALGIDPPAGIAVVADGMGGHPGGDVASREAADHAIEHLRSLLGRPSDQGSAPDWAMAMAEVVSGAHRAVCARGEHQPELSGMGTTLTAFAADPHRGTWAIGHVGDSRAYLLRHGSFRQLTRDDTWVQQRVDAAELTPEQAKRHPFGHILTQCLGLETEPTPQVLSGSLERGDVFLLCTDGLVGMLEDETVADTLRAHAASEPGATHLDAAAQALVAMAKDRGGYDNISVVLIAVG